MRALLLLLLACDPSGAEPAQTPGNVAATPSDVPAAAPPALVASELLVGAEAATMPVVIAVHGLGDSADNFVHVLDGQHHQPLRIVAPQAPTPWGDGGSWFEMRGARSDRHTSMREGIERLAEFVRGWTAAHPDAPRPAIMGFSQGGMLSFGLAAHHPELISLAVPVGGLLPESIVPTEKPTGPLPPIRALHGAVDERVPLAGAEATVAALQELGFEATVQSYPLIGHGISSLMRREISRLLVTGGELMPTEGGPD